MQALALVRLESADPRTPGPAHRAFCPDSGGTWPVTDVRCLLGSADESIRFVRFPRRVHQQIGFVLPGGDQLLLPQQRGMSETFLASDSWRRLLVRDGELTWFGIPLDSLLSRYARDEDGYRLRATLDP